MSKFYDAIDSPSKGAWVVHHGQKTVSTVNGGAEFPSLDAAGKAASLLSQLAASQQTTLEKLKVDALARAAELNPRIELPGLLNLLEKRRVIDRSTSGEVAVLGVTSRAIVGYAAEIFEDQEPTSEERATIALAEITSKAPVPVEPTTEFVSDEFGLTSTRSQEFLHRCETVGFVDAEGRGSDKLYFNGNLFRRDNLTKIRRVLELTVVGGSNQDG